MKNAILLFLFLATFSGCAAVPVQQKAVQMVAIETLQGSVNVSLSSPAGQMSGNGLLFFKRPDNFRLSILAPFGQIVLDIIVAGEQVTCLKESLKTGWQGTVADLPPTLGTKVWPLMKWIVESPQPAGPSLERFFTRADGTIEIVYYDTGGFVQRKVNGAGDEVFYSDYRISDGRALANRIELVTSEGSILQLSFDDPEINQPIDSTVLNPRLDGYKILPLKELKGF